MATRSKPPAPATRTSSRTTRSKAQPAPTQTAATTSNTRVKTTKAAPATKAKQTNLKAAIPKTVAAKAPKPTIVPVDNDREPIKAFLRIRPHLNDAPSTSVPYLEHLTDVSVRMSDPAQDEIQNAPSRNRFRPSVAPPTSIYSFSHVFPDSSLQSEFFTKTTLPLVRGLLDGENGLLFAYGVTNSGKTYTMQGGSEPGSAGILPRTLDVIFNSIEGLQSNSKHRPVRLHGIELGDGSLGTSTRGPSLDTLEEPILAEVLAEHLEENTNIDTDIDPTVLSVDRNHEYSIWLSYSEVYNEKIYDLLADVEDANAGSRQSHRPVLLTRKALPIKPSPPSDGWDGPAGTMAGKYVSGLKHIRVNSAAEAKGLVRLGQLHRRVFGTLANSQSSRSHGMVTIKLLRKHRGEPDEPCSFNTCRLTLVDLAGSERTKHTQTTGDRLKEAGNINKSLMVLGQCMEVMRANQRRVAQSLGGPKNQRSDTREVKKGLAVVPFRHSKLTEVLMDYFTGDGRAVMIVNVNPYDTGYDENSHVMKFAALAKEVYTAAPAQRVPPTPSKTLIPQRVAAKSHEVVPHRRTVTLSTGGHGGRKASKAEVEIIEEDEETSVEDDFDDEPLNPLVEALFDELEVMRMQVYNAEMRCAIIEAETREEVMQEMEERIRTMEKMFARRLMNEVEQHEMKMDAKIDMLHQSGLFGKTPGKSKRVLEDLEEEVDVEMSIIEEEDPSEEEDESEMSSTRSDSLSPLAGKSKPASSKLPKQSVRRSEIRVPMPSGPEPEHIILPSDDEEAEDTGTETESRAESVGDEDSEEETEDDEEEDDDGSYHDGDTSHTGTDSRDAEGSDDGATGTDETEEEETDEEAWVRESSKGQPTPKAKAPAKGPSPRKILPHSPLKQLPPMIFKETTTLPPPQAAKAKRTSTRKGQNSVSELTDDMGKLAFDPSSSAAVGASGRRISNRRSTRTSNPPMAQSTRVSHQSHRDDDVSEPWGEEDYDDSAIIMPKNASKKPAQGKAAQKKTRQLGSTPVVMEDQYDHEEEQVSKANAGKTTRRNARGSK